MLKPVLIFLEITFLELLLFTSYILFSYKWLLSAVGIMVEFRVPSPFIRTTISVPKEYNITIGYV